jgi:hypothetical protein
VLPSFATIMRRFARWHDALAAAGFANENVADG